MHTNIAAGRKISLIGLGLVLLGCAAPKTAQEAPERQGVELQGVTGTRLEGMEVQGAEAQKTVPDAPLSLPTAKSDDVGALLRRMRPVTTAMINDPIPGSWLTWRRNPQAWGYSPLKQINKNNVKKLRHVWSWSMNDKRTESQPLVHDGVMFLNQSSSIVQALDATNGDLLWSYERKLPPGLPTLAYGNRNIAILGTTIFTGTSDAFLVALDARTGKPKWEVAVGDYKLGHHYSSGPVIADGLVVIGMSGCYHYTPGGCWISAHDPASGKEVWRRHTIVRPGQPGDDTWAGVPLEQRYGGSVWMPPSYDPVKNVLYVGTAVPIPWGRAQRGHDGDALHTNSTLALDPKTGAILWNHQHIPGDNWDMDVAFERHVVRSRIQPDAGVRWVNRAEVGDGHSRDILVGFFGKSGIVEALDAVSGRFLWGRETIYQNVIRDIDPATGRATLNSDLIKGVGQTVLACPFLFGGRNWPGASYSPDTNAVYASMNNTCMNYTLKDVDPKVGAYHDSASFTAAHAPRSKGKVGRVEAVDVATGKTLWKHEQRAVWYGSLLATGGGLVFGGDVDRWFNAFDDKSGHILWRTRLAASAQGYPISYEVNGKQYLAVPAGVGLSIPSLTPEIRSPTSGSMLYVFAVED